MKQINSCALYVLLSCATSALGMWLEDNPFQERDNLENLRTITTAVKEFLRGKPVGSDALRAIINDETLPRTRKFYLLMMLATRQNVTLDVLGSGFQDFITNNDSSIFRLIQAISPEYSALGRGISLNTPTKPTTQLPSGWSGTTCERIPFPRNLSNESLDSDSDFDEAILEEKAGEDDGSDTEEVFEDLPLEKVNFTEKFSPDHADQFAWLFTCLWPEDEGRCSLEAAANKFMGYFKKSALESNLKIFVKNCQALIDFCTKRDTSLSINPKIPVALTMFFGNDFPVKLDDFNQFSKLIENWLIHRSTEIKRFLQRRKKHNCRKKECGFEELSSLISQKLVPRNHEEISETLELLDPRSHGPVMKEGLLNTQQFTDVHITFS